ncbi:putative secreted calcium-binding protein [Sphingobium yanoikuyae]|uniref:Putative secreted calcium-binding protein n=1 Tax=Sphingobium yanoikuyae TaxID=13690 RepID=A0A084EBG4_SPHYA|nr:right-handed parallel beta-helix repeat-containing protein [Sphingobium yanoikuyae]KEZ15306.1 putative secreted calcium-binding protein [Sphingobium yanoikuyae]
MFTYRNLTLGLLTMAVATVGIGATAYHALGASDGPLRVDSPQALAKAIAGAKGSTIIQLAPGQYGDLAMKPSERTGMLVIESADPNNPAILQSIKLYKIKDIAFRNLTVRSTPSPNRGDYVIDVVDVQNIILQKLQIRGIGGAERGREYGLMVRASNGVRLQDSNLSDLRYGVGILNATSVSIERNEFHGIQTDGIRGGGATDLLVAENILGDFSPKAGEHPDGIQLWSTNQKQPGRRITIRDNLVARHNGGIVQGIFIRDTLRQLPFEDVTVSGNLILGGMYNGIALTGIDRGAVSDNWVIAYPDMKSWISLNGTNAVSLTNNRAMQFLLRDTGSLDEKSNKTNSPVAAGDLSSIKQWLASKPKMAERAGPYLRELAGTPPHAGR